ncbi:MAG: SpoIIE family protein phosphatase [Bernardetiaceae bacterium]|nr:SpoIIE family protein phosphatase [Bernardetiaceae bacterium]
MAQNSDTTSWLKIQSGQESYLVSELIEILPDSEQTLGIAEVIEADKQGDFLPFSTDLVSSVTQVHWLKLAVSNELDKEQHWYLSIDYIDHIDIYIPQSDGSFKVSKNSSLSPLRSRSVPVGQFLFVDIPIPAESKQIYYIKMYSETIFSRQMQNFAFRKFHLHSPESYVEQFEKPRIFYAFCLGAILIMLLYNLVIWGYTRDVSYFYYVLYVFLIGVFIYAQTGYIFEVIIPDYPVVNRYVRFLAAPSFIISYLLFAQSYLRTKIYVPVLHYLMKGLIYAFVLLIITFFGQFWIFGRQSGYLMALGAFFIMITASIICIRKGYQPAHFFVWANILFISSGIIYTLYSLTIIPNTPFTKPIEMIVPFTIVVNLAIFSLGLASRFNLMKKELVRRRLEQERERQRLIKQQNEELEGKVLERTAEIMQQKEEIRAQRDNIQQQNQILESINDRIENQNRKITDSIRYANTIQKAMLPPIKSWENVFSEYFLIYLPKDIVSGDFYWYSKIENKVFIAVVDCTGHGVPGAFMSMVGNSILDDIINSQHKFEPSQILECLDKEVKKSLHQEDNANNDGMDIALCMIENAADGNQVKVSYVGAKRPLFVIRKDSQQVETIKGNNRSIGGVSLRKKCAFKTQVLDLQKGDAIYLTTDGFVDQNDDDRNKYGTWQLKRMLLENKDLPMRMQGNILRNELQQHQGNAEQRDDITFLGIRL